MIPLRYNLRSLRARIATTFATAFGIALVVFVLAATLMLSAGIKKTLSSSGRADTAMVMRKGSNAELGSVVEDPNIGLILAASGIKKDDHGAPISVAENVVVVALAKIGASGVTNVQVRGVPDAAFDFRPEITIVAGRRPKPGTDEAIIGKAIRGRFKGVELGESFELRKNRRVSVVGVFQAEGSSFESEVWMDRDAMRSSFGQEGGASSVRVRLESASAFDRFKVAVEEDKSLTLHVDRENVYYEKQSEGASRFVTVIGTFIAVLFSIGAVIGATITMHAAVANRQREIGTLRALGFPRWSILSSFVVESMVLALAGGMVGAVASIGLSTVHFSMMNYASWSEMVFRFEPGLVPIGVALVFSVLMGFFGGLIPAIRASRVSPIAAMRS